MLVCPNAQCPFALAQGRPAEYRETFTTCSDCQTALVPAASVPAAAPKPVVPAVGAPLGPALITAAIFVAIVVASFIPLLEQRGEAGMLGAFNSRSWMSLTTFGLNPFLSSFLIVELVALIPALNRRRVGTFAQRKPLVLAAIILGGVTLLIQSTSMTLYLRSSDQYIGPVGELPPVTAVGVMAVVALLVFGATALIDRAGIGNGFAVVIAALTSSELYALVKNLYRGFATEMVSPVGLLLALGALGAAAFAAVNLTAVPHASAGTPKWAPLPASTLQPVSAAGALLSLPASFGMIEVSRALQSSAVAYNTLYGLAAAVLAVFFGWLFFRPAQVAAMWKLWRPAADAAPQQAWASGQLGRVISGSIAVCLALSVGANILSNFLNLPGLAAGVLAVVPLAVIAADVFDEARARQQLGPLVAVRPLVRLTELEPMLSALGDAKIPAFARSGRLRSLLGFFAPYAPVTLLVPVSRADEARKIVER